MTRNACDYRFYLSGGGTSANLISHSVSDIFIFLTFQSHDCDPAIYKQ